MVVDGNSMCLTVDLQTKHVYYLIHLRPCLFLLAVQEVEDEVVLVEVLTSDILEI